MSQHSPLASWLRAHSPEYLYKLGELREAVTRWLTYIPATFQHYTSHTVDHSDEIILQVSKLLFEDDDPERMVVPLSATEVYILAAAAYLHDAGMVASEDEKARILSSREWKEWAATGPNKLRVAAIATFRSGTHPDDNGVRNYLADLQTRFLLAEFIRRHHHLRSGSVVERHENQLGRFAFHDAHLLAAIANVCIGHGLWHRELVDGDRFPEERDIRGEKVNLRFIAILLRLGDLLDLRTDRACPMLLNAACPLPPESYSHWTQYGRITHRLTTPSRIEITAECATIGEHRVLRDWCKWIVDEAEQAGRTMRRARRHSSWKPPAASLNEPQATIRISPAPTATYVDVDWTFEIDPDAVFERLIRDVHRSPMGYLRELLQNSLDATRCRMFDDAIEAGITLVTSPTALPIDLRIRYPIILRLASVDVLNELSGEVEKRQTVTISDSGTGMSMEIVRAYLLQVGRSWYMTREFGNRYPFVPSSQFGVGFLSVFGVSSHVEVDTWRGSGEQAIRVELTGPRNYVLVEKSNRTSQGTAVTVATAGDIGFGDLVAFLKENCPRVEIPIIVQSGTETYVHRAESPKQFIQSSKNPNTLETYEIRAYPVECEGIEGELYVFVRVLGDGSERWDVSRWWRDAWRREDPGLRIPEPPVGVVCINGMVVAGADAFHATDAMRLDYRSASVVPDLARRHIRVPRSLGRAIEQKWEELISAHLSTVSVNTDESWRYRQRLAGQYALEMFWHRYPGTIPIVRRGELDPASLAEVSDWPTITLVTESTRYRQNRAEEGMLEATRRVEGPTLISAHLEELCSAHADALFETRRIVKVGAIGRALLRVEWGQGASQARLPFGGLRNVSLMRGIHLVPLGGETLAVRVPVDRYYFYVALNQEHPLIDWMVAVRAAGTVPCETVTADMFDLVVEHVCVACDDANGKSLVAYLERWRALPGMPENLRPPAVELNESTFRINEW